MVQNAFYRSKIVNEGIQSGLRVCWTPLHWLMTLKKWIKNPNFWHEICLSEKSQKNVIFSDFTHSGVSKMPIPRGDAGAPNSQETDAGTQGPGPIEPDFGFRSLEALFWKSNFHHFSLFSNFKHFWLENGCIEHQKSKKNQISRNDLQSCSACPQALPTPPPTPRAQFG